MKAPVSAVEEIQGLYGAFSFPERLLQKIWARGDFERNAVFTVDGRRIKVLYAGRWNLLGGPDFKDARFVLDGRGEIVGDVEMHLRAVDWDAHAHVRDRAYDRVVLHVVLFPPEVRHVTRGSGGQEIPTVALLPLLHQSLEEYAAEDAVEKLANRPSADLTEELAALAPEELKTTLRRHAAARWRQKVHFARLRVERLGWDEACHQTALEILGYRFNRAPMLRIAGRWPLAAWTRGVEVRALFAAERETNGWSLQAVRPANHPRARLQQYANWTTASRAWPERWRGAAAEMPEIDPAAETRAVRRTHGFTAHRERVVRDICGDALGGTRFDTLMCDGLLPLLATQTARALEGVWFHWFAGDLPPFVSAGLRQTGVFDGRAAPAAHGFAQGVLGWLLAHDAQR